MDWSIQEIAKLAGTTSRTLRHYDDIGLLVPTRIGSNGYRHYDDAALVRLQRILLLRELGLGLPAIGEVLDREASAPHALRSHLEWLRGEQDRLARQIASVVNTIGALEGGEQLMAENMFDGFDHTQYKEEVEERWGKDAYAKSDAWWRSMSADEKAAWQQRMSQLGRDWISAFERGVDPAGDEAQAPRSGSSTGCAAFPARRAAAARGRARSTSSASPRCTWPTSASARTTAARRVPSSCATR